jgi:DNA-directed RNA polymerase subunit K/omega
LTGIGVGTDVGTDVGTEKTHKRKLYYYWKLLLSLTPFHSIPFHSIIIMPPTFHHHTTKIVKDYQDIMVNYDPSKNISMNILTKYEKTSILGLRMEQLARGAQSLVEVDEKKQFDPYAIAYEELLTRKIPFMLCRTLPNGVKEYWRLQDVVIR